jgi:hypothetical protein
MWITRNKYIASVLLVLFALYASDPVVAHGGIAKGEDTAERAASWRIAEGPGSAQEFSSLQFAQVEPDTTEFQFPEEKGKHLYRDIAVFVVASVFVAVFIIKVFLEKDKDETPDTGTGGKGINPQG